MFIEPRSCPRCAALRTLRLFDGRSFCCNCKFQWAPRQTLEPDPLAYMFTREELARLAAYRAAVQAGLYSDWSVDVGEVSRDGLGDVEPADDPAPPPSLFT